MLSADAVSSELICMVHVTVFIDSDLGLLPASFGKAGDLFHLLSVVPNGSLLLISSDQACYA